MKRILFLLVLTCCCGQALATQDPHHVRISLQYLSIPLRSLNELLAEEFVNDAVFHDKVMALSTEGKATLLDSNMIVCRSGHKATVESIREEIFPTEYDPGDGLDAVEQTGTPLIWKPFVRPWGAPAAFGSEFETRNTGMTLEVASTLESPSLVWLRMVPEMVVPVGLTTWMEHADQWGKADIRMPLFETWRSNTTLTLKSGRFALVSTITPKRPLPVPFVETRILLFVRADVLGTTVE